MNTQLSLRFEFAYDKGRLLLFFLILSVFTVGCVWVSYRSSRTEQPLIGLILMWSLVPLLGFAALTVLLKVFKREPGLVISGAGIHIASFAAETIPWLAIRDLERLRGRGMDNLLLRLDPAVVSTLSRRGLMSKLPKALRGSGTKTGVSLKILQGDPDWIYEQCWDFLRRAREDHRAAAAKTGSSVVSDTDQETAHVPVPRGQPLFTYALIAVLVSVYAGELAFGVDAPDKDSPTIQTLLVLGGIFRNSILGDGQWWRLFTAPFLHGNLFHLLFNCIALWLAGRLLERLIGWRWFAGLFCISALGGSIASLVVNPANLVGVGASGGIVGLFAAAIVLSFHFRSDSLPTLLRIRAIQILIPSLMPFMTRARDNMQIDYAAHLGGAVAGGAMALMLLAAWPRVRPHPRFGIAALTVSIAFAVIATVSLWPISQIRAAILADPFSQYFRGQYQLAAQSFTVKAQRDEKAAPYYYLWRFLAEEQGRDTKATIELRAEAGKLDQAKWPYPVYKLFLGELNPGEVIARATDNNSLCEAIFYIGEWHLLRKEVTDAHKQFQAASLSCPSTFMEYDGARGELQKLAAR
ncbi:rhomboid family intramembrane serine protease [Agrobacterium rhizogenes]|jgi:rhomboid protease GluP|uniref:rhomboid family intramembrane serine protease n=1 Tax=Rhizobium rhizogenes TaxID=359 RepID=UPI0004D8DFCA|nr:rhomboid family intramembrane serine protease [Rhizobium rhizogenes]OCJ31777.1 rhomboid family intramembrane serine protease [Agrobacterium sp. B133/95]KEA07535.1 membrane protein [Rhizobium rhizogenes]MQB29050.1 rhomboid family intramembrane serine protease [Rhizobium rhizogenes]NTF67389.1 rhomboid family intramembrane serine protease [Rhizobium rhizogenes]NTG85639.1 rhomboid family intramembrane serine protease [Rhizobium rhizogenes]